MWRLALVMGLALAGCFSTNATTCADGTVCPDKKVCAPAGGACVDQEQIDSCQGIAAGGGCQLATIGHGVCRDGVCVAVGGCGDCVVETGEVCDDCNTVSGDGCRADCQKIEMCGDGIVDEGEACDDANADASDGCDMCRATEWLATPIIGGSTQPLSTLLDGPTAIASDRAGNIYFADDNHHRVLRLDRLNGIITTIAGTGDPGFSGDGGPATSANLDSMNALAVDGLGNVFISIHSGSHLGIRRVDGTTGIITSYAGNGQFDDPPNGGAGDNGAATLAKVRADDIAVDGVGNLYIVEAQVNRLRRVDPSGVITTILGGPSGVLTGPNAVATDTLNNIYVAEVGRVIKLDGATGQVTTIAGNGIESEAGDGGPATSAQVQNVLHLAVDVQHDIYLAETTDVNPRVRKISASTGLIDTIVGGAGAGTGGDGGPASAAQLLRPGGICVDPGGNLWITQQQDSIIREVHQGVIDREIGAPGVLFAPGELTTQRFGTPGGITVDAQGRIYVSRDAFVLRLDPGGPTVVAGSLLAAGDGDGGPATQARLYLPRGLTFDTAGNLYIADAGDSRVRRVDGAGIITTVAGTGSPGYSGDGGPATAAQLDGPVAVAVDANGNLYIADRLDQRVRKVDTNGVITTFAGTGFAANGADGVATSTPLNYPAGVAVDGAGNVYIGDQQNNRVRKVGSNGMAVTVAGDGIADFSGDGGPANVAELNNPGALFFDATGRLYIVDTGNARIRRIDTSGTISTVAGSSGTWWGDGGLATSAGLGSVIGAATTPQGALVVLDVPEGGDTDGHVRIIDASGIISTVAGKVEPEGMGAVASGHPVDPGAMAITPAGLLVAGGSSGTVQALGSATIEAVIGRYLQDSPTGMLARYRDRSYGAIDGLAFDAAAGVAYISAGNEIDAVTLVDPTKPDTWTIAPLAGAMTVAGFRDGVSPLFHDPAGLAFDPATHALYVADTGNHVVRAVDTQTGSATTVAGTPRTLGFSGDGGSATVALLNGPTAIALCGADMFIADTGNNRVRRIASGAITTVLGDGVPGSSGQGTPASTFPVDAPRGLACDAAGNLFVTSTNSLRLLASDAGGIVDGSGPVATIYGAPPRTMFPESVTRCLNGVTVVDDKTVRISDSCTGMLIDLVRQVKP